MTGASDISSVITAMLRKLISEYAPEKVVLFGSHAYGVPGPESDIDLLIVKETSERLLDRCATVRRVLTGTHPGLPINVLVLTPRELEQRLAIGDQFVAEIAHQGTVLYAA